MSTYLALTFGTLLSSQGTDASFGPPSSGPSGRFVLSCFQLIRCFPLRFPGLRHPTRWCLLRLDAPSDVSNSSRSPLRKANPAESDCNPIKRARRISTKPIRESENDRHEPEVVFQRIGRPGTVRADACPVLPARQLEGLYALPLPDANDVQKGPAGPPGRGPAGLASGLSCWWGSRG